MTGTIPTCVVLAGGESSRLWPLDDKSLISFMGRPLLELQLEVYVGLGFRDIAVVCNRDNLEPIRRILSTLGPEVRWTTFVQEQPRGMGDALLTLEPLLAQASGGPLPVYICQVHDIFDPSLHQNMLDSSRAQPRASLLAAYQVTEYFPGGYLMCDPERNITGIVEKPGAGHEPSNLVNIVAHVHPDLGQLLDRIRIEYGRDVPTDDHYERAMASLMATQPFKAVPYQGAWRPIKFPWHVLGAMEYYLGRLQPSIAASARIAEGVQISGPVCIEEGVRILPGADIRGPAYIGAGSLVGQNANVRESMIAPDCIIGVATEVNRSYVGRGARIHAGRALDAVLADNTRADQHVNLSAGMITANFRTDAGTVCSTVKGQRLDTGLTKLGAILGAGAFVGVGAMLMPGVKIGRDSVVGPLTLVMEDVPDHTLYYSQQQIVTRELPHG